MHARTKTTIWLGGAAAVVGLGVRLAARALVPAINESWHPGDWIKTHQAFWEGALSDIGVALLLGGLIIVGIGMLAWCRDGGE